MKQLVNETVTISRKEYERLQRAEQERDQLREEIQEGEIRAEQREAEAHADAAEEIKEERARTKFWVKAWWDVLFWLQGAWDQVHALSAKLTHNEKLITNANLKAEHRIYLQQVAPLTVAPKRRDKQGRALISRDEAVKVTGLPKTTCYRVAKELQAAGLIDAKVYSNPGRRTKEGYAKKERFEKFAPEVAEHPEALMIADAPKRGGNRPRCPECQSENVNVCKTITCQDCGIVSLMPMFQNGITVKRSSPMFQNGTTGDAWDQILKDARKWTGAG